MDGSEPQEDVGLLIRRSLGGLIACLLITLNVGCAAVQPPRPTPAPIPTSTPEPAAVVATMVGEDLLDVEEAFVLEAMDLVDELDSLSLGDCEALADLIRANPALVPRYRGMTRVMLGIAEKNPNAIGGSSNRTIVEDLTTSLQRFDDRLKECQIASPP